MGSREEMERSSERTESSTSKTYVVAAIDFGTTYSRCAYSFKSDLNKETSTEEKVSIFTNTKWDSKEQWQVTEQTPTTILFAPKENFDSFGDTAENKYAELADVNEHIGWHYFSRFKMNLHGQTKIRREMKLKDDQGHQKTAMKVFSEAIKYLKIHLLTSLYERIIDIEATDIHWVITVPAIWDDGAKQFMREAANEAGIPNNRLDLALEPESAAIYCKAISVKKDGSCFEPGTKFLLADLGGGTADMTIQEVGESGNLTELSPPSGGPYGGTKVDAAFNNMLENIYGESNISSFSQKNKSEDLELKRNIEVKKRTFDGVNEVKVKIPTKLTETLKERGRTLEQILSATVYEGKVIRKIDKIQIAESVMSELFEDVKENIIQHMMELLRQHPEVNMIVMVGGFSESVVIKKAVHQAFPGKKVIFPPGACFAVVKGAVMYGNDNSVITSRLMPFTYGVSVAVPFDDRKHPESKKILKNGNYKCEDNFKVFIRAGETVIPGKTTFQHICNASTLTYANVEIYRTKTKFPVYVDEPGSSCIGSIQLQLNDIRRSEPQHIRITMSFGSTELSVQAEEEGTNNAVMAKFNFLH